MPELQSTTDELLAAIDLVTEALEANGHTPMGQLTVLRHKLADRADADLAIGRAYVTIWHAHLDANDIDREKHSEPTPLLAGRLIRAAVEATGATITPAPKMAEPEGGAR